VSAVSATEVHWLLGWTGGFAHTVRRANPIETQLRFRHAYCFPAKWKKMGMLKIEIRVVTMMVRDVTVASLP
jgi:hypothetical protein